MVGEMEMEMEVEMGTDEQRLLNGTGRYRR